MYIKLAADAPRQRQGLHRCMSAIAATQRVRYAAMQNSQVGRLKWRHSLVEHKRLRLFTTVYAHIGYYNSFIYINKVCITKPLSKADISP